MIPGWKKMEQRWRRQLLSYARGNVLEIGVGHGANFSYYPIGVHVTGVDTGRKLVDEASKKAAAAGVKTSMIVGTIEDLNFSSGNFDTIVSTFSLCDYEDPGYVLESFSKWCKADGVILLLEYGLSSNAIFNWVQRKVQPVYYKRSGQHICRDLLSIISASGLGIKKLEVKYAGTVYMIWACIKPGKHPLNN